MSIARVSLEEAYRLRPESPEAATAMIDVCKAIAIEPEELTVWFDRVIDAQITWMPAMPEYMWAVRPRWHGSLVHMLDFARWVAAQAADNDDFADYFFTMIEFVGEDFGSHREIWYDDQLAHSARVFLTNQIAKGRNPNIATQRLLGIAWARREWAEGEKLLKGLDNPKSWAPLQHFRVHYQQAIDDILLGSAIFPGSIPTGLSLAQEERYWEAVGILSQALASPKTNQDLRDALRRVIVLYKWRDRYSAGDTVELAFEDGLPGWRTWLGRARAEDGAALIGADNGNVWLSCDLDPGERYELTIDCEAPKGKGRAWSRVLIGHNWRTPDEQWHTVELRWHDAKARMRYRFDNRQSAPISGPLDDGKVHLRIVTFDGDLLVEADGQLLYRGPLAMGYTYMPGTGLYLSAWIGGQGRDAVFRNARIKPLNARPNELDGPATQLLDQDN